MLFVKVIFIVALGLPLGATLEHLVRNLVSKHVIYENKKSLHSHRTINRRNHHWDPSCYAVWSISSNLAKSRDSKRKSDLDRIKIAFEDYYGDTNEYPPDGILSDCGVKH